MFNKMINKMCKGSNDNQMIEHSVYLMDISIVCLHNLIYYLLEQNVPKNTMFFPAYLP